MKRIGWVTLLAVLACGSLSYAQVPDGGIGGHAPAKSTLVTSDSFSLTGSACPSSGSPDCAAFPAGVQEVFSFYNQSGNPFNSISVTLDFSAANGGDTVGCAAVNIKPTWTTANCLAGVPIPVGGGDVTLTFQEGTSGTGISCYNTGSNPTDPVTSGNKSCLTNSFNNSLADLGGAKLPFINYLSPTTVQTSGPCTLPPNSGVPLSPLLVCGYDSWILGIGLTAPAGTPSGTFGYGTFADVPTMADVTADFTSTPEPPTLLLVGAAMFGMSLLLMKKKAVDA